MMRTLATDLRFAVRIWLKRPGFAAAVALTLALGIGASTAIFSVVHSVLINPLPLPESDRLVTFWLSAPAKKLTEVNLTPGLFINLRERTKTLQKVAAYETGSLSFTGRGEPEQLEIAAVTADYFGVIGADAFKGRTFLSGEDAAGSEPVAILSYELWQRRFAGADIIGQSITLDNTPTVIVGVMPPATNFPNPAEQANFPRHVDLWVSLNLNPTNIYYWNYAAVGRLNPGFRVEDARDEINALWSDFYQQNQAQLGVG